MELAYDEHNPGQVISLAYERSPVRNIVILNIISCILDRNKCSFTLFIGQDAESGNPIFHEIIFHYRGFGRKTADEYQPDLPVPVQIDGLVKPEFQGNARFAGFCNSRSENNADGWDEIES